MGSSESSLPMEDGEPSSSSASQDNFVQDPEDPWWWEIENQNLLLDVVTDEVDCEASTSAAAVAERQFDPLGGSEQTVIESAKRSVSPDASDPKIESASEGVEGDRAESEAGASGRREQSLEEFKEELKAKRMARQTAVNDLREEILSLRRQLAEEREGARSARVPEAVPPPETSKPDGQAEADEAWASIEHRRRLIEESDRVFAQQVSDDQVVSESTNPKVQLAETQLSLQLANAENLSLQTELGVTRKQVVSLKEVVACCKQMISMKEEQVVQLKAKLREIEDSLAERELKLMSDNLRQEYDRQLANMRTLRQLYEERARVSAAERENLQRQIAIKRDELEVEKEKTKNVENRNTELEKELESVTNELIALKEQCSEHRFENKTLKEEMDAVNKLFSQMLMGFNGTNNLDIDRLTTMLEENRTLLNDMATKEATSDGATLPKLLFELVQQAAVANIQPTETESSFFALSQTNRDEDDGAAVGAGAGAASVAAGAAATVEEENDSGKITRYCTRTTETSETPYPPSSFAGVVDTAATSTAANGCGVPTIEASVSSDGNAEQTASGSNAITTTSFATTAIPSTDSNAASLHGHESHPGRVGGSSSGSYDTLGTRRRELEQQRNLSHNQSEVMAKVASAEEIIGNLPKVWKVLMELLSHHKIERVQFKENGQSEDCFKSVETPNGPKAELSVSKTYIKLKDLILEKKSLVKETNRLKTLNCHLEYRLNEQEKRLSAVSLELQKTWHLVGKMQRQHRQLHTQEQILRYQLQQKRRLLNELKDELEYCRRKWAAARAKNDESQIQCDDLRKEFAKRKLQDAHNSAESGYSDGLGSDEDDTGAAAKDLGQAKNWADVFEVKKTIKRMQSTSPGRSGYQSSEELRWSSAPPAVKWPNDAGLLLDEELSTSSGLKGPRRSRSKVRGESGDLDPDELDDSPDSQQNDRTTRIQKLEEQCKSLIAAVIQTSDNRERLEVQLCRFQDEIAPAQYAVPLEEYIAGRARERMKRASSAPEINDEKTNQARLTAREEEYTRRRSERLERLEEESRQLMSRIKRTSDKGNSLRSSIERIHSKRALSRDGSFESNTEEVPAPEEVEEAPEAAAATTEAEDTKFLTEAEEEYTSKRAERLKRLEEESRLLLSKLSKTSERGTTFNTKLDALHEKYGSEERDDSTKKSSARTIEERLENVASISTNRDERLRILEEESRLLVKKLSSTADRSAKMIDHLSEREQARNISTPLEQAKDTSAEVVAGAILPTPKTVACSSIVSEEITERVVITRTPSQIAQSKGAIPKSTAPQFSQPLDSQPAKSQPTSKLCASGGRKRVLTSKKAPESETLEEMVTRLRSLPFPSDSTPPKAEAPASDSKP